MAVIDGDVARRLGLSRGSRITVVATGSANLTSPGTVTLVLRFTKKAKAKLRPAKRLRLTVFVTVSAPTGSNLRTSKRVLLRR